MSHAAPMLIGLTGAAGSGKNVAASYLEERYAFVPLAFADPLRDMLGALLPHVDLDSAWMVERALKEQPVHVIGTSYRALAQTLGTEWGRGCVHPDLWLRIAEYRANQALGGGDHVVLTDVRFPNEAAWLRAAGGTLVRIERDSAPPVRAHESEQHHRALRADHVLLNHSSLAALEHRIDALMEALRYPAGGDAA